MGRGAYRCLSIVVGGHVVDCVVEQDDVKMIIKPERSHVPGDTRGLGDQCFTVGEHGGREIDSGDITSRGQVDKRVACAGSEFKNPRPARREDVLIDEIEHLLRDGQVVFGR